MKKIMRVIIIFFALGMIIFSAYKLINIYRVYAEGDQLYEKFSQEYLFIDSNKNSEYKKMEDTKIEDDSILNVDFESLLKVNNDLVAWIYGENSPINYPVVQGNDNDYYLYRMLDGTYNIAGSIFMDYRNSPDLSDLNTIIYGHNLKNDSMFGSLRKYSSQEYYEENPDIYFSTLDKNYKIELISGYKTDIASNIYNIPKTDEELQLIVEEVMGLSSFKSKVSIEEGDRLMTLSTCTGGEKTSRYILIGKLVELVPRS